MRLGSQYGSLCLTGSQSHQVLMRPLFVVYSVKDASSDTMYSFLPASWVGDTHEETDVLPIGNREERWKCPLNRRTDSPGVRQVPYGKVL